MTGTILEVKDLVCGYDSFLIKDINFKVNKGEFIAVIGPNGSGKTSLLRAITRILKPKKGSVYLEGKNIRYMGVKEIARKIAVVSQDPGVSHITVEDFVLLGRIPHHQRFQFLDNRKDFEIAETSMELTGTFEFRDKLIGELSGGERQLVLIARALAQEPELVLLDEPTTFLDISHQVGIMDLIKRLNRESGLTVIMVLHDLNLAGEYSQRLLLMKEGRIHKSGTPDEVLTYQTIEEVYETLVVVGKSPVSSRPYIFVVTEEERKNLI
ncbi:MAG: ATP-binding cassette domain-containing protein [Candidatus Aminicenantes bacterium]|nr:ATP-binding cassette domain-containing protein [Candidatus Aminicenantes bacterium]NIM80623.1 ATP-binding cassette domain-containing protein [Candidatus Aminicenantes bacterium]NIN20004.1 ATP-binding cassette domain-containing protein [Candidatus Aminicenantes bacterium]NIN47982.1 ATP-binding cassette domain-containing protein [Candidatus Aminicenantes bacterium]NIN89328.1 ATP-binding cassette domain-containing protein [Candidatus Aminicenantes bacterium]